MSATHRKGRRVAAARYPYQAVRGSPRVGGQRPPSTHKAPNFALVHYFSYFQLYLEYELVYRRYRTITSLYRYRGSPCFRLQQAENRGTKPRPLRCAAQSFSIAVGLARLASLRRSTALAFALCVGHAPTTARAQDDEIARRALAVRCGRGRRAHSRQAQLRRPLSCVYKK